MSIRHGFRNHIFILGLLLFFTAGGMLPASAAESKLLPSLRDGGYVIYFRHAQTEWSQYDQVSREGEWVSCDPEKMRQLSTEGRDTAKRVGAIIRQLGIPVGQIYASEYCRSRETAELLGLGPVETTRDILNARSANYIGGEAVLSKTASSMLSTRPVAGTNTILVAHGNVIMLVAGLRPVEAGAVVIEPLGNGRFNVVRSLTPDDWGTLE